MELTNKLKKYIRSLHLQKYRQKYNKFIVEGPKICSEFTDNQKYKIDYLICTHDWLTENESDIQSIRDKIIIASDKDLNSISSLKTANKTLIVAEKPIDQDIDLYSLNNWVLYMDKVQDPGNMGTIIRIADWYGIDAVIASPDSVDFYNPKVVQASMGSHNRIKLHTILADDLPLEKINSVALVLGGQDIETITLDKSGGGILILGNESKGIRGDILDRCNYKASIMRKGGAESLNVAVACGIACNIIID